MPVMGNKVPMFKLRPYKGLLIAALFVGIVGGLLSAHLLIEDAYLPQNRGVPSVIVTSIMVLLLILAAFSRYRFRHLHHRRPGYKRG